MLLRFRFYFTIFFWFYSLNVRSTSTSVINDFYQIIDVNAVEVVEKNKQWRWTLRPIERKKKRNNNCKFARESVCFYKQKKASLWKHLYVCHTQVTLLLVVFIKSLSLSWYILKFDRSIVIVIFFFLFFFLSSDKDKIPQHYYNNYNLF